MRGPTAPQRAELPEGTVPRMVALREEMIRERMILVERSALCTWTRFQSCDLTEGLLDETTREIEMSGRMRRSFCELRMYYRRETARCAFAARQRQRRHGSRTGMGVHLRIRPL